MRRRTLLRLLSAATERMLLPLYQRIVDIIVTSEVLGAKLRHHKRILDGFHVGAGDGHTVGASSQRRELGTVPIAASRPEGLDSDRLTLARAPERGVQRN